MGTIFKLTKSQEQLKEQMKQSLIENPTAKDARFVLSTMSLTDGRVADFIITLVPREE